MIHIEDIPKIPQVLKVYCLERSNPLKNTKTEKLLNVTTYFGHMHILTLTLLKQIFFHDWEGDAVTVRKQLSFFLSFLLLCFAFHGPSILPIA